MVLAVGVLPPRSEGPLYFALLILWLLMTWWRKEPGHLQQWYWPSSLRKCQAILFGWFLQKSVKLFCCFTHLFLKWWNFFKSKWYGLCNIRKAFACNVGKTTLSVYLIEARPHFYQTRWAWSVDQGSNKNHSPAYNFAPTVTKFCVMWEGLSLPHDTKFGNCRCKIVDSRAFPSWSLIHGLRWSGLIKAEPGDTYMCNWTGSSLVHIMACHLFGAKPLPEPIMTSCQLDPWQQS